MDWKEIYSNKLTEANSAVLNIKSGDRVVIGHAASEPQCLINAMVNNYKNYKNVEIVHMVPLGPANYAKSEMKGHFTHNSLFAGKTTRDAIKEGRAEYTPSFFYQIPRLFKENYLPIDVALIKVSSPDIHGYCSYSLSCDYTKAAAESAKIIMAEVNKNMPRVLGDNFIHISEIDFIVESDLPNIELKQTNITDIEKQIGEYCSQLIEDGSTLQLGIGSIPDAVLMFLKDKKNLGIHSEMISDGVVDLYNNGVITNKEKILHPGKIIATFLMGSKKLYDFVDNNPVVNLYPVDYVNDPSVIMKNNKMISINSCIQVDFMGQVASESIGSYQFSGTGGQVDYVRGTSMALGGKSIIALPSTASNGTISRIVPYLDKGAVVTTSRNDVHYIVTEYGIADLRGKTLSDRARSLIKIAHPKFRETLENQFLNFK